MLQKLQGHYREEELEQFHVQGVSEIVVGFEINFRMGLLSMSLERSSNLKRSLWCLLSFNDWNIKTLSNNLFPNR